MCYKPYAIQSCKFGTFFRTNLPVDYLSFFCFLYLYICLCFLCIVICMHSFHSADIFIVYNSVICTNPFNNVFYNGHIVLNYTGHFVYNPLNSYVYLHWILDFKYIIIISLMYMYMHTHI